MPENVPDAVTKSFTALIPGFVILLFWGFISFLSVKLGYDSIFDMIVKLVSTPLLFVGTGIVATIIAVCKLTILGYWNTWWTNCRAIMSPIWLTAADQNRIAYEQGQQLPHIITSTFMDSIVWIRWWRSNNRTCYCNGLVF